MEEMKPLVNDFESVNFSEMNSTNMNCDDSFFTELDLLHSSGAYQEKEYSNELDSLMKSLGEAGSQPSKNAANVGEFSRFGESSSEYQKLHQRNKELQEHIFSLESQMAVYESKLSQSLQDFINIKIVAENFEKKLKSSEKEKSELKFKLEHLEAQVYQYKHLQLKNSDNDEQVPELEKKLKLRNASIQKLKNSLSNYRTEAEAKQKLLNEQNSYLQNSWKFLLELCEILSKVGLLSVKKKSVLLEEFNNYCEFLINLEIEGDKHIAEVLDQLPAESVPDMENFIKTECACICHRNLSYLSDKLEPTLQKQFVSSSVLSPPLTPSHVFIDGNPTQLQNVKNEIKEEDVKENISQNQGPCSPDSHNLIESEKEVSMSDKSATTVRPSSTVVKSEKITPEKRSKCLNNRNGFPISRSNKSEQENSENKNPIQFVKEPNEKSNHPSDIKTETSRILSCQTFQEMENLLENKEDESYNVKDSTDTLVKNAVQLKQNVCVKEQFNSKPLHSIEESQLPILSDNTCMISNGDLKKKDSEVGAKGSDSIKNLADPSLVSKTPNQSFNLCDSDEDIEIADLCSLKQQLGLPNENFKHLSPLPPTPPCKSVPNSVSDCDLSYPAESSYCIKKSSVKKKLHFTENEPVKDSIDIPESCSNLKAVRSDQSLYEMHDQSLSCANSVSKLSKSSMDNVPTKRFYDGSVKQDNIYKPKYKEMTCENGSFESTTDENALYDSNGSRLLSSDKTSNVQAFDSLLTVDRASCPEACLPSIDNKQSVVPQLSSSEHSVKRIINPHQKPNLSFKMRPLAGKTLLKNNRGKPVSSEDTSVPVRTRGRTLQSRTYIKKEEIIEESNNSAVTENSFLAVNSDIGDMYERPKKVRKEHEQYNTSEMFNKSKSDHHNVVASEDNKPLSVTSLKKLNGSFSKNLNVNMNSADIVHSNLPCSIQELRTDRKIKSENKEHFDVYFRGCGNSYAVDVADRQKSISNLENNKGNLEISCNTSPFEDSKNIPVDNQKFGPLKLIKTENPQGSTSTVQELRMDSKRQSKNKEDFEASFKNCSDSNTVDMSDSLQARQNVSNHHESNEGKAAISCTISPFEDSKDISVSNQKLIVWNNCRKILANLYSTSNDVVSSNSIPACSEKKKKAALKSKKSNRKAALKRRRKNKKLKELREKTTSTPSPISHAFQAVEKMRETRLYSKEDENSFVNAMLNPTIVPDKSTLLFHVFQFLLASKSSTILTYSVSNSSDDLLPVDEKCIVSALLEIETQRKSHLQGLLLSAVNSLHEIVLSKNSFHLYALSSLCRVLTEICRRVNCHLKPLALCCDLLKMNHKFAPYLIASVAGVWKDLFQVSDSMSNEELIFHSAIAYGAQQNNINFKSLRLIEATKKLLSDFLNAPDVTNVNKIVDTLMKKIEEKCASGMESEYEYAFTAPLKIFAVYENWSWTEEYLLGKHILPGLMKYGGNESNISTFNVFCNLYAEIFSLCPGQSADTILIKFLEDPVKGKTCIKDSAAVSLIKLTLLQKKVLPTFLQNWFRKNQTNPRTASIRVLLNRNLMSEKEDLTQNDIL